MTNTAIYSNSPAKDCSWARIASQLAESIAQGIYVPGQRLPSEHALAGQFGVNRHTIRRSLANLCQQGMLRVAQGSGTYVEDFAVDLALGRRTRHRQNLMQAGLKGRLHVLASATVEATPRLARKLQVAEGQALLWLKVLGEGANTPLQVSERYFPLPRFAALEAVVRETGSITDGLSACGVADYTRLSSRVSAEMPSETVAADLRQTASRPVLKVESLNVDTAGVPIEFSTAWFAGDRVSLTITHDD
jgi:GntR family phosphonate transport system transcriptional regulator